MKHSLFFVFFMFSFLSSFSQSVKNDESSEKKELSDYEFLKLEKGYAKMLASETHTQYYQNQQILIKKKNGLVTPDHKKDKKWMIDEAYTKKWLAANIEKTKYKSADEAYNLMLKSVNLMGKQIKENADVYDLLSRASKEQRLEVLRKNIDYIRDHQ